MTDQGRILIADDEETFLHATVALLHREGYTCDGASDAARALRAS
jgi:DNA-binding response OmpR family regulator